MGRKSTYMLYSKYYYSDRRNVDKIVDVDKRNTPPTASDGVVKPECCTKKGLNRADSGKGEAEKASSGRDEPKDDSPEKEGGNRRVRGMEDIIEGIVRSQFGIVLSRPIYVVPVYNSEAEALEPSKYPRFTLIRQTIFGGLAMFQAVLFNDSNGPPGVLIDTVGVPFMYPLLSIMCGTTVISYTHYPVISLDMIEEVKNKVVKFNNSNLIVESPCLTKLKLLYYKIFTLMYSFMGRFSTITMVNGTWTRDHILHTWGAKSNPKIVFPPCNVTGLIKAYEASLESSKLDDSERVQEESMASVLLSQEDAKDKESKQVDGSYTSKASQLAKSTISPKKGEGNRVNISRRVNRILSVGQFRPEKNHMMQIEAFHIAKPRLPPGTTLALVGGVRNRDDYERAFSYLKRAKEMGLEPNKDIFIYISPSYGKLVSLLTSSMVGLHTMKDEHFGIAVVEYMAAGALALAHSSAGPKFDIICDNSDLGRLATTAEEFADKMVELFLLPEEEKQRIRDNAINHVKSRFSDEAFGKSFVDTVEPVISKYST